MKPNAHMLALHFLNSARRQKNIPFWSKHIVFTLKMESTKIYDLLKLYEHARTLAKILFITINATNLVIFLTSRAERRDDGLGSVLGRIGLSVDPKLIW